MQMNRRGSAARHCRRDLLRDDAGLADTQQNDFSFAVPENRQHWLKLILLQTRGGLGNRIGLSPQQLNNLRKRRVIGHAGFLIYDAASELQAPRAISIDHIDTYA